MSLIINKLSLIFVGLSTISGAFLGFLSFDIYGMLFGATGGFILAGLINKILIEMFKEKDTSSI